MGHARRRGRQRRGRQRVAELLGRDQAVGVAVAGGRVVVGLRQMDGLGGDRGDLEGYRPTDRVDLHHLKGEDMMRWRKGGE